MKRLFLILKLLALALPMLGSDCGPGLSYGHDLEYAERQFAPQWSPDGALLVWGSDEDIFSVNAEGSRVRVISESRELYDADVSPAISPDGSHILYATFKHTTSFVGSLRDWEIESSRIDGTDRRRLTNNSVADVNPVWSPDGSHIAWVSGSSIQVMQSDGSNAREIAPSVTALALPPRWSPDGGKIAFIAREERDPAEVKGLDTEYDFVLYVVAEDGPSLTWVSEALEVPPSWSPDSLRLAFGKPIGDWQLAIYTVNADGSGPSEVLSFALGYRTVSNISWSPSGSQILFYGDESLSVIDPAGTVLHTFGIHDTGHASWSPDGTNIAVHRRYQPRSNTNGFIFTMAADGSDWQLLTELSTEHDWTPKLGERLQMTHRDNLIYLDPAQSPHRYPDPSECTNSAAHQGTIAECMMLLQIGESLAANPPLDWDPREPLAQWEGVGVGQFSGGTRVVSLRLYQRSMTGSISPALGSLAFLEEIDLRDNWLTGNVPKELDNLSRLQVLNLSFNRLSGSIPSELGNLGNPVVLGLDSNMLHGHIPPELGSLFDLESMFLGSNSLSGQIPSELGNLHRLQVLDFKFNELSDEIPAEFAGLKGLVYLRLRDNELTGRIPPGLGSLPQIQEIDLGYNRLVGPIPSDMLTNNASLSFVGLELNECVPSEWKQHQHRVSSFGFGHVYCDDGYEVQPTATAVRAVLATPTPVPATPTTPPPA